MDLTDRALGIFGKTLTGGIELSGILKGTITCTPPQIRFG